MKPVRARTPGIDHKNKCEPRQGWHNAWREIPHCFKILLTQKKHAPSTARSSRLRVSLRSLAPPWLAASLRSSPLSVALCCVANAPSHQAQFSFLRSPGFHSSRLRCCAAPPRQVAVPPRAIIFRPCRGSNLGSLALAIASLNSYLSSAVNCAVCGKLNRSQEKKARIAVNLLDLWAVTS